MSNNNKNNNNRKYEKYALSYIVLQIVVGWMNGKLKTPYSIMYIIHYLYVVLYRSKFKCEYTKCMIWWTLTVTKHNRSFYLCRYNSDGIYSWTIYSNRIQIADGIKTIFCTHRHTSSYNVDLSLTIGLKENVSVDEIGRKWRCPSEENIPSHWLKWFINWKFTSKQLAFIWLS